MSKFATALTGLIAGYLSGAVLGAGSIMVLSNNTHDKSLEAVMTGAFVIGPLCAALGLIAALALAKKATAQK